MNLTEPSKRNSGWVRRTDRVSSLSGNQYDRSVRVPENAEEEQDGGVNDQVSFHAKGDDSIAEMDYAL